MYKRQPCIELKLEDLIPASELFATFVEGFSVKAVSHLCEKYDALLKPSYLKKPRRIIGGKALQNEEVGHNSFGANIAAELGHIFNPSSIEDRIFIVRNGYIPSKRRESYIAVSYTHLDVYKRQDQRQEGRQGVGCRREEVQAGAPSV